MKAVGMMGGAFDPVHFGHLRCAIEVLQDLELAEVRLIPTGIPPHRGTPYASPTQRAAMVKAAVADQPGLRVDERELTRPGPSYTVDTLASLRQELGETPLCLMIGIDAFLGLPAWDRWQELFTYAHLVAMRRPGWEVAPQDEVLSRFIEGRVVDDPAQLQYSEAGRVLFWEVTQLEISSTRIRQLIKAGKSIRFLVPEPVRAMIEQQGLYR